MNRSVVVMAVAVLSALASSTPAQEKGGTDETGPYDVVDHWWKPPEGRTQHVSGVWVESRNRIFVTTTNELPSGPSGGGVRVGGSSSSPAATNREADEPHKHFVLVVDANGNVTEEWTQWKDVLVLPHKVVMNPDDPDKHVWIVDRDAHQVFKFTNDGKKLVMVLGERKVPGADDNHFNRPADLAFLPGGTMFVADGYENTRVVKFDRNGRFLKAWGTKGSGPGQFNLVHGVAVDAKRRVYVADRNNDRVQVFDEHGRFLDAWPNIRNAVDVKVSQDQSVWVTMGFAHKLAKYDAAGKLLTHWGSYGSFPGGLNNPHQLSVDPDGNLYIADSGNNRVQKFTAKSNADPARLVGQPHRTSPH